MVRANSRPTHGLHVAACSTATPPEVPQELQQRWTNAVIIDVIIRQIQTLVDPRIRCIVSSFRVPGQHNVKPINLGVDHGGSLEVGLALQRLVEFVKQMRICANVLRSPQ